MKEKYDPCKHHRRSIRLKGWDYGTPGVYFVTIVAQGSEALFGDVSNGITELNKIGQIVVECWKSIPDHFLGVNIDEYVVMPNHIHGIIVIVDPSDNKTVGATHASPLDDDNNRPRGPYPGSLGAIIGSFKSAVTRRVNQMQDSIGSSFWQRGYYERIVRNERELNAIRNYIRENPQRWEEDRDNLDALINRMKLG